MNHARIADAVFNRPQMIEPNYGRVFVSALARQMPDMNIQHINLPDGTRMDAADMAAAVNGYQGRERKVFQQIDGFAVIPIEGTLTHRSGNLNPHSGMTGYDGVSTKIDAALADDSVRGILLDIDSPGGAVAGCFDLSDQIFEARQQKPVWGLVDELCASAGFALASACNRLVAPRTAQIGSVGVVTMHVDQSQFLADMGVDVTFIHAGKHKVDGNSFAPLPDEVRAAIQADIDEVYGMFVDLVARNRGMSTKAVRDTEARVYGAKNAGGVKFIDQIMPARNVLSAFDKDLRAGRAGATMQSPKVSNMRILGLGRGKSGNKAAAAERHEPTIDPGSEPQADAADDKPSGQHTLKTDAAGVISGFHSEADPPNVEVVCADWSEDNIAALEAAGFTINRDASGSAETIVMPAGKINSDLPPASDVRKESVGTGEQMHAIDPDKDLSAIDIAEKRGFISAEQAAKQRAETAHHGDANGKALPASLDALVELFSKHKCDTLAKPLRDRGVTLDEAEKIMADVDDIRDKASATFPDDKQAADNLADNFIQAAYVEQTFGSAFGSLMVEASARMAGDEIDHHQPEPSQAAGKGSINAVDFYKR